MWKASSARASGQVAAGQPLRLDAMLGAGARRCRIAFKDPQCPVIVLGAPAAAASYRASGLVLGHDKP